MVQKLFSTKGTKKHEQRRFTTKDAKDRQGKTTIRE